MPLARAPRLVGAAIAAGAFALSFAGPAVAKEIGSGGGGGGGGTTACNPVSSLTAKGDATTSDTAAATIAVNYSVKGCDKDPVRVDVEMHEYFTPATVVYDVQNAALSAKFTVGVRSRVTYLVTVTVTDTVTGGVQGKQSLAVAAIPKGV